MAPPRKFDHDEALRLHEEGMTIPAIARLVGVADSSVRRVCDPGYREACLESARRNGKRGACVDCSAPIWSRSGQRYTRCRKCYHETRRENLVHGVESGYSRGCKCGPCRAAATCARQRRRLARAVPCTRCGKPRLDHRDGGRGRTRDTGLCASCYHEELRRKPGGIATRQVAA